MNKKRCYLCNSDNLKVIKTKLRYDINREVFACRNCDLVFLEPKNAELKKYYNDAYRKIYSPVLGKLLDSKEIFDMYLPFQQQRIDRIKYILNSDMRVLEIGCSSGHFLYSIKNKVRECVGIEFNEENAEFVNKKLGIKVYTDSIEKTDLAEKSFDLIILYFTLEHIEDPINLLKIVSKYLKDDGKLVIEVPNIQDSLLSIYNIEEYSDFWFREPHTFYFSLKTLKKVTEKAGFVGNIKTFQEYNILNQMNWILKKEPQKSVDMGMSIPQLIESNSVNKSIKDEFNKWIIKINKEYCELLNKHELGENLLFIGRKNEEHN